MKTYILMTQWGDGEPEVSGVFSSFRRAVAHFVRERFRDSAPPAAKLTDETVGIALKMAHRTDDDDFADFGDVRAWIEEHGLDEPCAEGEGGGDDGK